MNGRALVVAGAAQLAVSLSLLLIAGTTAEERLPRWGGPIESADTRSFFIVIVEVMIVFLSGRPARSAIRGQHASRFL